MTHMSSPGIIFPSKNDQASNASLIVVQVAQANLKLCIMERHMPF